MPEVIRSGHLDIVINDAISFAMME